MRGVQTYVPFANTFEALSIVKTTGMTGFQIITKAPLTFVGATFVGNTLFGYAGSVAGNNPVGVVFNTTSLHIDFTYVSRRNPFKWIIASTNIKIHRGTFDS